MSTFVIWEENMTTQQITIRQIDCFLMLAKTLNFSKAAEKLYISQPTFSRQIHMLEENLGVKLFYYSGRRVRLSTAGSYLQVEFEMMRDQLDLITHNAKQLDSQYVKTITIGLCDLEELPALPHAIRQFREKYPETFIKMKVGTFYQLTQDLEDNKLDIVCCMRSPVVHVSEVKKRALRQGHFFCLVPMDNPLAQKETLTLDDIAGQMWIFRVMKNCTPVVAAMQQAMKDLHPGNGILYSSSPEESALLVKAGMGVSVVVGYSVSPSEDYRMLPFKMPALEAGEETDLIALWNCTNAGTLVEKFVDILSETQREMDND